jgi:hypothetical protein
MPSTPEQFTVDYTGWLQTTRWPSEQGVAISVDDMPPQYAAAALAKLLRWSFDHHEDLARLLLPSMAVDQFLAYDPTDLIRTTPLAQALSARATSRQVDEVLALMHHAHDGPVLVDERAVAVVVLNTVWDYTEDKSRLEVVVAVTKALFDNFDVVGKGSVPRV